MKVLNLQCSHQHSFEGWFGSEDDYQSQLARGLVECPICSDNSVHKMPSAPRLNLGVHQAPPHQVLMPTEPPRQTSAPAAAPSETAQAGTSQFEQAAFLRALRHVVANTEDVGDQFADQARAMHYGDAEARSIRGQASAREAVELLQEGIDVMPLLLPAALKETLQ